jgi:hypothetical protein
MSDPRTFVGNSGSDGPCDCECHRNHHDLHCGRCADGSGLKAPGMLSVAGEMLKMLGAELNEARRRAAVLESSLAREF